MLNNDQNVVHIYMYSVSDQLFKSWYLSWYSELESVGLDQAYIDPIHQ